MWITYSLWSKHRSSWKPCVSVLRVFFSRSKRHLLTKYLFYFFSEIKLFRMARFHFTSTTSWELAFPSSHMVPLSMSRTTQVTQTTNIDLTGCSSLPLELGGSLDLSVLFYPKWVVFSLSSKSLSMLFKKLLFVEYPSLGNKGIQTILLLGFGDCSWFTIC